MPAIQFLDEALYLRSSATQTAFVRALFLTQAESAEGRTGERLTWHCRVRPTGTFFIVLDAELGGLPLRVQVAPYGAHVTTAGPNRAATGLEVALPARWSDQDLRWSLERRGTSGELRAGDHRLWQGEVSGSLTSLAFGETNVDPLHGGEMWLSRVEWRRLPSSGAPS